MIVGTWASSAAPTTSPMAHPFSLTGPAARREHGVLDVAVEVERVRAAFAADAGLAAAAERGAQVADEETVDPHRPGAQPRADPLGTVRVAGDHGRGQAEPGVVGHGDRLVLVTEGLHGQDGPEDLLGHDLRAGRHRREDGRLVEQAAEVAVGAAAEGGGRPGRQGTLDEAVHALEMRTADQTG